MPPQSTKKSGTRGEANSSITRVRPFFQQLLDQKSASKERLSKLLSLAGENSLLAEELSADAGNFLPHVYTKRWCSAGVLKEHEVSQIFLEQCFEKSVPPPTRFLPASRLGGHPALRPCGRARPARPASGAPDTRD